MDSLRNIVWSKLLKQYILLDTRYTFEGWETILCLCDDKETEHVASACGLAYYHYSDEYEAVAGHSEVFHEIKNNEIYLEQLLRSGDFCDVEDFVGLVGSRIAILVCQKGSHRLFLNGQEVTEALPGENWEDAKYVYGEEFEDWRDRNISWLKKISHDVGMHRKVFNAFVNVIGY